MKLAVWKSQWAILLLLVGLIQPFGGAQSGTEKQRRSPLPTRELADQVRRSLVVVMTQDHAGNAITPGSGFFFKPGFVATNLHVLKRASQGYVKSVFDGVSYKIAAVVGFDLKHDLCVLKLSDTSGAPLPLAADEPAVGDDILVAGNPEGLEASFSKGIVSGIRPGSGLIQMDAAVSPGSSGGPVVNYHGEVVGLAVSSLVEGQNLNFAVPVRYLREQTLSWNLNVRTVGGLAVGDLEGHGFNGPVNTVMESHADYTFKPRDTYVEGPTVAYTASKFSRGGQLEEVTFFKDGVESGKLLWEYSDDGLIRRHIDIDSRGQRRAHEYSIEDAVTTQAMHANFDETVSFGTQGDRDYQEYKYDSGGHLTERTYPVQGIKFVMKHDSRRREVESLEYRQGKLESATHSTYEDNNRGDWIKRHETYWNANSPDDGFTPSMEYYREITYYADEGR